MPVIDLISKNNMIKSMALVFFFGVTVFAFSSDSLISLSYRPHSLFFLSNIYFPLLFLTDALIFLVSLTVCPLSSLSLLLFLSLPPPPVTLL